MQSATLLLALVGCALAVPYGGGGGLVNTGHSAQYRHDDPAHGTYEFGYNEDHATGGTFRKEKGGPGYQVGSYGLRDADGRMRIVHYIADAHGFRVKISTNEEGVDVKQDPASTSLTSSVHHGGPIDHHLPAPVEVHAVAPLPVAENYYHQHENQHLPEHSSVHHQPEHHHQQHYNYIEQPVHYAQEEEVHAEAPVHRISSPEIYKHQHSQYEPQNHHHHHLQHLTPEPLYSSPTHAEPLTFGQRISSGSSSGLNKASILYSGVGGGDPGHNSHNYGPALGATLMASVYAGRGDADHHSHAAQSALPKSAYVPDEEASYGPAAAATAAEYSPTAGHYDQQNGGGGGGDYQLRGNYY